MAKFADELRPHCRLLMQAYQSVRDDLDPVQQEITEFRHHHLVSLLDRFSVRASLPDGSALNICSIISDVCAVLTLNTTSSRAFQLWKTSNSQLFEFAIKGVMDLIDLGNVSTDVRQQIDSLYQMLWEHNKVWDLAMDPTVVGLWTNNAENVG